MNCDICSEVMQPRTTSWTFYCGSCDHWQSDLPINLAAGKIHDQEIIEEKADDIDFLWPVREKNFRVILDAIRKHRPDARRILDIGSATGQFLRQAKAGRFDVVGIEPNPRFVASCRNSGLEVLQGLFPEAIEASERFDVIIFNDVLEHIPNAKNALVACLDFLTEKGVVVVNAPFSEGVFFQLSRLPMASQVWDRLWQKHFYTPHVHYYSEKSVTKLAAKIGCRATKPLRLDTLARKGTWDRINLDPALSMPKKMFIWSVVTLGLPVLSLLPADARFSILERATPWRTV